MDFRADYYIRTLLERQIDLREEGRETYERAKRRTSFFLKKLSREKEHLIGYCGDMDIFDLAERNHIRLIVNRSGHDITEKDVLEAFAPPYYSSLGINGRYRDVGVYVTDGSRVARITKWGYNYEGETTGHLAILDVSDSSDDLLNYYRTWETLYKRGRRVDDIHIHFLKKALSRPKGYNQQEPGKKIEEAVV